MLSVVGTIGWRYFLGFVFLCHYVSKGVYTNCYLSVHFRDEIFVVRVQRFCSKHAVELKFLQSFNIDVVTLEIIVGG